MASAAIHRGGVTYEAPQTTDKLAALITVSGSSPDLDWQFVALATSYYNGLIADGHYARLCESLSMPPAAVQFLFDHPFGTHPSPYATQLPPDLDALRCFPE